jgi:hypothetical protein
LSASASASGSDSDELSDDSDHGAFGASSLPVSVLCRLRGANAVVQCCEMGVGRCAWGAACEAVDALRAVVHEHRCWSAT